MAAPAASAERSGYLALVAAAGLFAVTTTLVKLSSGANSTFLVSAARFTVGIAASLAYLIWSRKGVRVVNRRDWALRGLYGAASMTLMYLAIAMTSGGRASMLGNTYPIFVAAFGRFLFGEKAARSAPAALALCTAGSVLVLNDGSGYSVLGDAFAILSAVFAGLAINHLKRARATDDPVTLYLSPCLFGLPVASLLALGKPADGSASSLAMLAAIGLTVFGAQVLMTWGYKYVSAARGSRVFYLETIFAVGLGALIGERLTPAFFAGAALIIGGLWLDGRRPATAPAGA